MEYAQEIQKVLEYVDNHLQEELTMEILAQQIGFSAYHFCRMFRGETGYSVMEYVRRRRLAFAAAELNTSKKIIDVAVEYGFETHSGFSKAFKRFYACSPEAYRRHAVCKKPELPSVHTVKKYLTGGVIMEPKVETKPSIRLAGFAIKTTAEGKQNIKDIPAFWTAYMTDGRMMRLHKEDFVQMHVEYGVCLAAEEGSGTFDYMIGVEVEEKDQIPPEYHVAVLPPATYAVFSSPPASAENFAGSIQGTWQYIFNEWLPHSGYEYLEGGADLERYDERCMSENGKVCDIYVPVKKLDMSSENK